MGPLKILNGIKLILDDQGNHLDSYTLYNQFGIIQVLQRSPIPPTLFAEIGGLAELAEFGQPAKGHLCRILIIFP
jgi:hypothetical protein